MEKTNVFTAIQNDIYKQQAYIFNRISAVYRMTIETSLKNAVCGLTGMLLTVNKPSY